MFRMSVIIVFIRNIWCFSQFETCNKALVCTDFLKSRWVYLQFIMFSIFCNLRIAMKHSTALQLLLWIKKITFNVISRQLGQTFYNIVNVKSLRSDYFLDISWEVYLRLWDTCLGVYATKSMSYFQFVSVLMQNRLISLVLNANKYKFSFSRLQSWEKSQYLLSWNFSSYVMVHLEL